MIELFKKLIHINELAKEEGITLLEKLDRLEPVMPKHAGVSVYKGFLFQEYACKCGRQVGDESYLFDYCPSCGRKILRPEELK